MISTAIFDMDGLMIDSNPIISKAYATVLSDYSKVPRLNSRGLVHTPGISAKDNWLKLVAIYGIDAKIDELAEKKNRIQVELIKSGVTAMPGLIGVLNMLRGHNVKLAVASSSTRELIEIILKQHRIEQYFDTVVSGTEVLHGKPAPDIFLEAANNLDVRASNCVALEDAIDGIRAAKAAGMKCIAIPSAVDLNNTEFRTADLVLPSLDQVTWNTINKLDG